MAGVKVVYHDVDCGPENELGRVQGLPLYYEADAQLLQAALQLHTDTRVVGGLICSGDQFVSDPAQLARIKQRFPEGMAVDMESGALAQVCHLYGVPFLSFEFIERKADAAAAHSNPTRSAAPAQDGGMGGFGQQVPFDEEIPF